MRKLKGILVVDDDPTSRFLTQYIIEEMQLTKSIYTAPGGQEALDLIRDTCTSAQPDGIELILLDINMPDMDGFEFLEAFQLTPNYQRSSVVMLTTSSNYKDIDKANQYLVSAYLNKPITREKLSEVVEKHF